MFDRETLIIIYIGGCEKEQESPHFGTISSSSVSLHQFSLCNKMGRPQNCVYCHRNRQVIIISMLFVLAASRLTQVRFMADGRAVSKLIEDNQKEVEEKVAIGSRPPRCEGRCSSCGQCEAIQVPVGPSRIAYSRGDDITNYKPMSWKCKCGNFIFNP